MLCDLNEISIVSSLSNHRNADPNTCVTRLGLKSYNPLVLIG